MTDREALIIGIAIIALAFVVLTAYRALAAVRRLEEEARKPRHEWDTVGVAGPLDASFNVEEINGRKIR